MKKLQNLFFSSCWFKKKTYFLTFIVFILTTLPLIYAFVYYTGGIKYVFSHTMYIPIILAGIFINPFFGVITAIIAGILLGPFMPIDTITNDPQLFINWFYRLIMFILVGFISGFASSSLRASNNHIKHLLSHHPETNLPNANALETLKCDLEPNPYMLSSVIIHNCDQISDVLGLNVYYSLLLLISKKLKTLFPDSYIIQPDYHKLWFIKPLADLEQDTQNMIKAIQDIKSIDKNSLFIDFTIGTYYVDQSPKLCDKLTFRVCDIAARLAKTNQLEYMIYKEQKSDTHFEFELISSFEEALKNGQTQLYYQPKIDLETLKPIGLEALIRWKHPIKGMIPPMDFIPIIEKTKLIDILTIWVLEETLKLINQFKKHNIDVPISINVSTSNINHGSFFNKVMDTINRYKISPKLIEFEVTEHVLMKNPENSRKVLNDFSNRGILISIDDFGTGYSSLAYLDTFNIDIIKIDRQFVNNITKNTSLNHVIKSTFELADKLGYKVIAEGVEYEEQMNLIKTYGCKYAQGYYFAKPMNQDDTIKWYLKELNKDKKTEN